MFSVSFYSIHPPPETPVYVEDKIDGLVSFNIKRRSPTLIIDGDSQTDVHREQVGRHMYILVL